MSARSAHSRASGNAVGALCRVGARVYPDVIGGGDERTKRVGQVPLGIESMLRRLYDWCVDAVGKPHSAWGLGAVSLAESSFFPVPPDIMLIPMSLARPERAWYFAAVCTLTSVAGGLLGYFIGAVLYDTVGAWLIHLYGYCDKVDAFRVAYVQYVSAII